MEIDDINFNQFKCWFEADRVIKLAKLPRDEFEVAISVLDKLGLISFTNANYEEVVLVAIELHKHFMQKFVLLFVLIVIQFLGGYLSIVLHDNYWYWVCMVAILLLVPLNLAAAWAHAVKRIEMRLASDGLTKHQAQVVKQQINQMQQQIKHAQQSMKSTYQRIP